MKRLLGVGFALALSAGIGQQALAVDCSTGSTLADLIGFGSTGCVIGDKTFANFALTPGGSNPPAADGSTIGYTTIANGPGNTWGFTFNPAITVDNGATWDALLTYTVAVTSGQALITSIHNNMIGAGVEGGSVAVAESYCLGGSVLDCQNLQGLDLVFVNDTGSNLSANVTFDPVNLVGISKDIFVGSDEGGTAHLSGVVNTVDQTTVPEPTTLGLLGAGLLGLGLARRRRG